MTLLCGVRHHGPGSARAVLGALEAHRPDLVLVEGPPEAQAMVAHLVDPGSAPPLAVMLHTGEPDGPFAFYPLASHSPELVALRWAQENSVPVRMVDAPYARTLELVRDHSPKDPLADIASLMGYDDPELWWEDTFEGAEHDALEAFASVQDVMGALRPDPLSDAGDLDGFREAHMRLEIRKAEADSSRPLAVVGAWHVPALVLKRTKAADLALLKASTGKPLKLEVALAPWSQRRLSTSSGYGAGVASPAWYAHLHSGGEHNLERWVTRAAVLLRSEGFRVSTASTIEAVRMARALGALRGRHSPSLVDVLDSLQAVLTEGDPVPLGLVHERLVVGTEVGSLAPGAPQTPLAADFSTTTKRLRLDLSTRGDLELDLREPGGRARSELLHQLDALGVAWGVRRSSGSRGTFKESWLLGWEPEMSMALALSSHLGSSVPQAATTKLVDDARGADLAHAASLVDQAVACGLDPALEAALLALDVAAASSTDVEPLLRSLPALARTLRYGSVRGEVARLGEVFVTTLMRASANLARMSSGLDDDASKGLLEVLANAHDSVVLVAAPAEVQVWCRALSDVMALGSPRLSGWSTRTLLDREVLTPEDVMKQVERYLTLAPSDQGVLWLEGLLSGSAALLLRDQPLLDAVGAWLAGLAPEEFADLVPLLRRTFSAYSAPEKRQLGECVSGVSAPVSAELDMTRARLALGATLRVLEASRG